jgi:hypothetical protein
MWNAPNCNYTVAPREHKQLQLLEMVIPFEHLRTSRRGDRGSDEATLS